MERKQKIEIGIALIIILALAGLLAWIFYAGDDIDLAPSAGNQDQVIIDGQVVPSLDYSLYPQSAQTIARVFAERFGSFSNKADYENVDSVMSIATSALQAKLFEVVEGVSNDANDSYYGISTHVLSVNLMSGDEVSEVYEVLTQREESIDSPSNTTIRYQTMTLTLVKEGESWLVDNFVWE